MERRAIVLKEEKELLIENLERNFSKNIIDAFKKIRREDFVLDEHKARAYDDDALPIISGQTISQPSTIAKMLEMLELEPGNNVLEIGAGSGYNASLIASIIGSKGKVYSIEFFKDVCEYAKKNVDKAGLKNVELIHGDGSLGYAKEAPYDRIIVTAACPKVPDTLIEQLEDNGILVAPVGRGYQKMIKMRKKNGKIIQEESQQEYRFVPLRGKEGFTQTST